MSGLLLLCRASIAPAQTGPTPPGPARHVRILAELDKRSDATTFGLGPGAGGIHLGSETKGTRSTSTFFLLVADGKEGRITVGESVPSVQWFYHYSLSHGYIVASTVFRTVSTGFRVIPTILSNDRIRLQIVPEISYFTDGGQGQIAFVESSLDVVVTNGQPVTVASNRHQTQSVLFHILGGYRERTGRSTIVMTITPQIQ
ncbi:MAG: hypothetical protein ACE5I9_11310 [Candidatus Methylomirabilales bacterium]